MRAQPERVITNRELNRALLARQMLLIREERSVHDALTHLIGLQSQAPNPPYIGLWTRLAGFQASELGQMLMDRTAVRIALMRSTLFVVTAVDALQIRPLVQPVIEKLAIANHGAFIPGVNLDDLARRGRALLEERPLTFADIGIALADVWPGADSSRLGDVVRGLLPLAQVPPRGVWGLSGPAAHTTLDTWLGTPLTSEPDLPGLVRRYFVAYGPATVQDLQGWCGIRGLGPVVRQLAPELVCLRDEQGHELWDLQDAPRPPAETPAPVRLLPDFDVTLLSHKDRDRIMAPELKNRVFTVNGIIKASVLVDGFVAGLWRLVQDDGESRIDVELFTDQPRNVMAEIDAEANALLAWHGEN